MIYPSPIKIILIIKVVKHCCINMVNYHISGYSLHGYSLVSSFFNNKCSCLFSYCPCFKLSQFLCRVFFILYPQLRSGGLYQVSPVLTEWYRISEAFKGGLVF